MYPNRLSGQAAIEQLTIYAWAILVIAVVLVGLFALGLFGGAGQPVCTPTQGYACGNPSMTQGGTISFTLTQDTGFSEYAIGLACTASTNATRLPYASGGVNPWQVILANGLAVPQVGNALFATYLQTSDSVNVTGLVCYGQNGKPVGKLTVGGYFTGSVFINYTGPGPGGGAPPYAGQVSQYVSIFSFTAPVR